MGRRQATKGGIQVGIDRRRSKTGVVQSSNELLEGFVGGGVESGAESVASTMLVSTGGERRTC